MSAELLELARAAARAAGELLLERFGDPASGVAAKSSRTDLVSDADRDAEALVLGMIPAERPGDAMLAEEGGGGAGRTGISWLVDPLDGTINYLWGVPQWSVSIAARDERGGLVGVVHDPCRGETFTAVRGAGARLGAAPIAVRRGAAARRGAGRHRLQLPGRRAGAPGRPAAAGAARGARRAALRLRRARPGVGRRGPARRVLRDRAQPLGPGRRRADRERGRGRGPRAAGRGPGRRRARPDRRRCTRSWTTAVRERRPWRAAVGGGRAPHRWRSR